MWSSWYYIRLHYGWKNICTLIALHFSEANPPWISFNVGYNIYCFRVRKYTKVWIIKKLLRNLITILIQFKVHDNTKYSIPFHLFMLPKSPVGIHSSTPQSTYHKNVSTPILYLCTSKKPFSAQISNIPHLKSNYQNFIKADIVWIKYFIYLTNLAKSVPMKSIPCSHRTFNLSV